MDDFGVPPFKEPLAGTLLHYNVATDVLGLLLSDCRTLTAVTM
jgi:hypothetical protein